MCRDYSDSFGIASILVGIGAISTKIEVNALEIGAIFTEVLLIFEQIY